jgi:FkbM family methyltransferase
VEPVDLSFQTLVKLSKDYPIKPIKYAITENGEDVEMTLNEKTPAKNCLSTHNHLFDNDGETIKVKSQTINQLIGTINEKINLVKIDCEGCEYNIFNSINDSVLKQIPKLMIETHDDETQKFIHDKLISNNFEVKINNSLMFALNKN